jgi:acetyl esterase
MAGDLEGEDCMLRMLAQISGVAVLSVDYCLAPENPFPQALDECVAVTRWARQGGSRWGIDAQRLSIGGDSAGANLALAAALDLRDASESWLRLALLIYGAFAPPGDDSESYKLFGKDEFDFGEEAMKIMWSLYLGNASASDPRAAPLYADHRGLPPVHMIVAALDPLRDDSRNLGHKLSQAGVEYHYKEYAGVYHGFMGMGRDLDLAVEATRHAASALRQALPVAEPATVGH